MISSEKFLFQPQKHNLKKDFSTDLFSDGSGKPEGETLLKQHIKRLAELQDMLFAHKKYSVLIILQGMDASGKDGIIKHVFTGINPQGLKVKSFSTPSSEEFAHDFLWRCSKALPERGFIGVFNRSYYEEVLIAKVHPQFLAKQNLPKIPKTDEELQAFWNQRYEDINNFEKYLTNNGTIVLKFFINISKEEQKVRFLRRIDRAAKNWKFRPDDLSERAYWNNYIDAYNSAFLNTTTDYAPWYIIPGDKKWFSRLAICNTVLEKLEKLDIKYPDVEYNAKRKIIEAKTLLLNEDIKPLEKTINPSL
ncbi:MAG: polyphosphate kinase 2 family protein [Bacteroidales bacterium]|nr:polyphosphate kinase 2 family protein [Bacteroidales bacterium]